MENKNVATFGGGCFWCVEAVIQRLKGIDQVVSGYAGGAAHNATYRAVCSGVTGHAEVIQVTFDPKIISYHDLITVFMMSHDPTTLNQQGADRGTQYRSIIMYHDDEQKKICEQVMTEVKDYYDRPIVTQVVPLEPFYPAEEYHQNYYNNNSFAGYCTVVINPKIAKLKAKYADKLKENS